MSVRSFRRWAGKQARREQVGAAWHRQTHGGRRGSCPPLQHPPAGACMHSHGACIYLGRHARPRARMRVKKRKCLPGSGARPRSCRDRQGRPTATGHRAAGSEAGGGRGRRWGRVWARTAASAARQLAAGPRSFPRFLAGASNGVGPSVRSERIRHRRRAQGVGGFAAVLVPDPLDPFDPALVGERHGVFACRSHKRASDP
jgi:hypothetical protein